MSTHRQSRGPRKVLNEADLERKQLESGSSTPVWLKPKPQHALAQIHAKAKSKVEAKEERNKRATKRSSSDDKENNGGKKKAATKTTKRAPNPAPLPAELPVATTQPVAAASQPQQDTRQATPPPAKRARTELPPMVRNEDPATASGRSNATPAPCMTEEEFTTWLAQQPGMMVPADQHRELLNAFRELRFKYEELKQARWPEIEQLLDGRLIDQCIRDARACADHWRLECDHQAALAREAGTADLQQEREANKERIQQLATSLAEAENAKAAALIRAAHAEKELAEYRARVMATTGVQTDAVELAHHSVQAPATRPMRLQLMPEGLEGHLGTAMPAKGVMVPTSTPGGTVVQQQHNAGTPIDMPQRPTARMPTPASAPQRMVHGGTPLGTHVAYPTSRRRASRLQRASYAGVPPGSSGLGQRQLHFDSSKEHNMSVATTGAAAVATPATTPAKNTPFSMMTGMQMDRGQQEQGCVRLTHAGTGFQFELKSVEGGAGVKQLAYRPLALGRLEKCKEDVPQWIFQEIVFDQAQRNRWGALLFDALQRAASL